MDIQLGSYEQANDQNRIEYLWPRPKEAFYQLDRHPDKIMGYEQQKVALCQMLPLA